MIAFYLRLILVVLIIATIAIFLFIIITNPKSPYKNLIKNISSGSVEKRTYSFARVQLLYWTCIILICYAVGYAMTGEYNSLNGSCLVLLGISVGTTAMGKIIDINQMNTEPNPGHVLHQQAKTKGFFLDILSDETGVSTHRFQAFIFNLLFGGVFIISFINSDFTTLPDFEQYVLGLLGLSSGTYIMLKTNENNAGAAKNSSVEPPTKPTTTETDTDSKPSDNPADSVSSSDTEKDDTA